MGSLNNLNVLNDLNVWNIPERKACLRGETVLFCQFNNAQRAQPLFSPIHVDYRAADEAGGV